MVRETEGEDASVDASEVLVAVATGPALEGRPLADGVVVDEAPLVDEVSRAPTSNAHEDGMRPADEPGAAAHSGEGAAEDPEDLPTPPPPPPGVAVVEEEEEEDLDDIDDEPPLATPVLAGSAAVPAPDKASADVPSQYDEDVSDAYLEGDERFESDRWLLSEVLAAGRARSLALESRLTSRGAVPYAAVALHLLHDGKPPERPLGGQLLSPLPLPSRTGLPVHVVGRFEVLAKGRSLPLTPLSSHADEVTRTEWNRELFASVAVAYHAALASLPRHVQLLQEPAESMYRYWPTEANLAIDELNGARIAPL